MTQYAIPAKIQDLLEADELANIRDRAGWAVGVVDEIDESGDVVATYRPAFIALLNGHGGGRQFGGVRFMAVDDDGAYQEAYAYGTQAAADTAATPPYFVVSEYLDPTTPDLSQPAP
jgi:hypothetical protein